MVSAVLLMIFRLRKKKKYVYRNIVFKNLNISIINFNYYALGIPLLEQIMLRSCNSYCIGTCIMCIISDGRFNDF